MTLFAAALSFVICSPLLAQDTASSDPMVVIDLRPQAEREGNAVVPLSGKCNQGVFRISDVASDPNKVEVLKTDLSERLGLAGDGKTLAVLNWSIYYNRSASRGSSNARVSSVMGVAIPNSRKEKPLGSKCSRKESAGGWYAAGDVTNAHAPVISEFDGTFAGKHLSVRVVHSPPTEIDGDFKFGQDDTDALLETVHKTADALAMAIVQ